MSEPKTATEMMMRLDGQRDHVEMMIRRCVDATLANMGETRNEVAHEAAYRAAKLAVEEVGRQLVETRHAYEKLAALTPPAPITIAKP